MKHANVSFHQGFILLLLASCFCEGYTGSEEKLMCPKEKDGSAKLPAKGSRLLQTNFAPSSAPAKGEHLAKGATISYIPKEIRPLGKSPQRSWERSRDVDGTRMRQWSTLAAMESAAPRAQSHLSASKGENHVSKSDAAGVGADISKGRKANAASTNFMKQRFSGDEDATPPFGVVPLDDEDMWEEGAYHSKEGADDLMDPEGRLVGESSPEGHDEVSQKGNGMERNTHVTDWFPKTPGEKNKGTILISGGDQSSNHGPGQGSPLGSELPTQFQSEDSIYAENSTAEESQSPDDMERELNEAIGASNPSDTRWSTSLSMGRQPKADTRKPTIAGSPRETLEEAVNNVGGIEASVDAAEPHKPNRQ